MNSPLDHGLALPGRAEDDLYVVSHLCADAQAPGWVLGFHAQQAVEKALKAVLSAMELPYPRTHNLVMLAELLRAAGETLPATAEEFGRLTPFGVVLRYEDVITETSAAPDAVALQIFASGVVAWARERLDVAGLS